MLEIFLNNLGKEWFFSLLRRQPVQVESWKADKRTHRQTNQLMMSMEKFCLMNWAGNCDELALPFLHVHMFDSILHKLIDSLEPVPKSSPIPCPGGPNEHRYSGKARREKRKKLATIKQVMEFISLERGFNGTCASGEENTKCFRCLGVLHHARRWEVLNQGLGVRCWGHKESQEFISALEIQCTAQGPSSWGAEHGTQCPQDLTCLGRGEVISPSEDSHGERAVQTDYLLTHSSYMDRPQVG